MDRPLRNLSSGLAILLLCTAAVGFLTCREAPPVLKVGCQGDTSFRRALEIAIKDIRRSGSPVRVEVVYDKVLTWTPADVVRTTDTFCRDPEILAVIGFTSSDASLAAARMLDRHGIPLIIPTATSPKLMETGRWIFKLCPNDSFQACWLADIARNRFKAKRCALVFQNNDYGRDLSDLFRKEFSFRGGEITFAAMAGSGFTNQDVLQLYVRGIVESAPDLLVLICQSPEAVKVKELLDRDQSTLLLLAADGMGTLEAVQMTGNPFDGLPLALFYHPDLRFPGDNGFAESFRKETGKPPGYESALAYDALMLLHQAVREGARTREEVRTFLASQVDSGQPYQGVAGPITFDEYQETVRPLHLGRIENRELVLVPEGEEIGR